MIRCLKTYFKLPPTEIKININIDGLPLSKSSGSQFWPILISIETNMMYTEPFVVGMYHGMSKPNDANEFLRPFVEEASVVLQNGLINGQSCNVVINAILYDAPAKSFITYTKGHTGYFACSKCIQEGDFICIRVTYPEINSPLRIFLSAYSTRTPHRDFYVRKSQH